MIGYAGWETATHYFNDTVNYTEPLFVVVIMALASTRPIIGFAEAALRRVAGARRRHAGGVVGGDPDRSVRCSGSFITEPAAMTICALLLGAPVLRPRAERAAEVRDARPAVRERLDRRHAHAFRRAAGADGGAAVGLGHAVHARALRLARGAGDRRLDRWSTSLVFRRELAALATRPPVPDVEQPDDDDRPASGLLPVPAWVTAVHMAFMAWTVLNAHYPGAVHRRLPVLPRLRRGHRARTRAGSSCKAPLLVGLLPRPGSSSTAGCRAGGLRRCWRACRRAPLFFGATLLTAFNDNALITYLATLVPNLERSAQDRGRRGRRHRRRA